MPQSDKHSKTEKPTAKRRRDTREKGQVARSPDVAGSLALLVASFVVPLIFSRAESAVLSVTSNVTLVMQHPTVQGSLLALEGGLRSAFFVIVPVASIFLVLGLAANIAQVGFHFSLKGAAPKFSHISVAQGVKRLFSPTTTFGLVRQMAKLSVIGGLAYQAINGLMHAVPSTVPVGTATAIGIGGSSILGFVRGAAVLSLAIGFGDFAFQRRRLMQAMKMTKQEVKDEARQSEGDAAMKGEMRKRQYSIARSKVLANVRIADVIVANPTHVAIALQYNRSSGGAPRVVSKGVDLLAARIRQEATVCAIPIVEDPPLARYLYATCEIGHVIPSEIYFAVAKLLAFVYSLPATVRGKSVHYHPPSHVPYDPSIETITTLSPKHFKQLEGVPA